MTHPRDFSDDLDWLAFSYWKDELSDEQRQNFEMQLGESQLAREALARVVELTEAVCAVETLELPQPKRRPAFGSPVIWGMTIGAAVCLCVMFVAKSIQDRATVPIASNELDARRVSLAIAWDELRVRFESESQSLWGVEDAGEELAEPEVTQVDLSDDSEAVSPPPSWMEAALLGMADESQDDEEEWEG